MIHKKAEIKNIWEAYTLELDHDFSDSNDHDMDMSDDHDMDMGDYDDNVVDVSMDFDTSEPVKPVHRLEDDDDFDSAMVISELKKLAEFANRLEDMGCSTKFEPWMTAKLTKAADYVSDVYFRLSAKADYANGAGGDHDIEL
jgi:hypothetical protein